MEKPSFKSSPWIRGAPHRVFSRDIRRTRWRISLDTGGRPGFLRRDFHVQKSLNPLRCQPMTVSGLTITRAWRQPGHRQDRMTQKTLSAFRSNGRGLFRFRTATCCRRARISVWSAARSAKISMILCMPERVSGGDAKFQGFCDRWNKWEGHPLVARQGHTGWTTRSAGRVWNGRFLAQGRRSASSLRTPRGLTTAARIRSIPLCGDVDAAGIRMPLHRFAGTIRRNKHRDDRAHGRLQNPLAQNDVRAGEPSRRWEARWNKWKGQVSLVDK